MKKLLYTFLSVFALMLCIGISANAAPEEMLNLPQSAGLLYIDIYNPETVVSTTTQSDYVLSGVAKSGTTVSVYYKEKSTGKYKLMYVDGVPAVKVIGASGYYAQRVRLNEGKNDILIRVDTSAYELPAQIVPLEINLLVDSFWDKFRSTSLNIDKGLRNSFR